MYRCWNAQKIVVRSCIYLMIVASSWIVLMIATCSSHAGDLSNYVVANTAPPDDFLALRAEPSAATGIRLEKMPNGTPLQVFEKRPDGWWRVQDLTTGQIGWAKSVTRTGIAWIVQQSHAPSSDREAQPTQPAPLVNNPTPAPAATAPAEPTHLPSNPPPAPALSPPAMSTPLVSNPSPAPTAPAQPTPGASNQIPALPAIVLITTENAAQANTHIADLKSQIAVLTEVLSEQVELQKTAADDQRPSIDKAIEAVNAQIERLQSEYSTLDRLFGIYLTSIKPNDRDLYLTARKASEIYPKIPYYIPGTNETGEFWVEPNVSDSGEMQFGFKFVDIDSSAEKVRETIVMSLPQIEDAQKALFKLHAWSEIAHQQKLRRNYEKRVTCFPVSECPPDGERVAGKASTEVRFNVYEDGSTAGRIQRNNASRDRVLTLARLAAAREPQDHVAVALAGAASGAQTVDNRGKKPNQRSPMALASCSYPTLPSCPSRSDGLLIHARLRREGLFRASSKRLDSAPSAPIPARSWSASRSCGAVPSTSHT